ncbi:hypothetical protein [Hyphobacterium sp.]|uniref:hypothetical protein n=1 Tax=Hyphobacterium sp. TaxID=2004662 RepID=UPI003BAC4E6D
MSSFLTYTLPTLDEGLLLLCLVVLARQFFTWAWSSLQRCGEHILGAGWAEAGWAFFWATLALFGSVALTTMAAQIAGVIVFDVLVTMWEARS